jgi:hypothetical protein
MWQLKSITELLKGLLVWVTLVRWIWAIPLVAGTISGAAMRSRGIGVVVALLTALIGGVAMGLLSNVSSEISVLVGILTTLCFFVGLLLWYGLTRRRTRFGQVFRFWNERNHDHLYTTDPNGAGASEAGYVYEGAPFRLFPRGTPGTTALYEWHNSSASRNDHLYTTDPNGEIAPREGYTKKGIIGYVSTTPLPGTVRLTRWWNPQIGDHFYSTDPSRENLNGYNPEEDFLAYVLSNRTG